MRTTLDIDDDVLAAAKELSRQQRVSTGRVVSGLMRQALTSARPAAVSRKSRSGVAGFRPFAPRGAPVTNEQLDALRDAEGV